MTALVYVVILGLALVVVAGVYGPWSKAPKAKPLIAAGVVTAAVVLAALVASLFR